MFKKELTPILFKLLQKIGRDTSNSFFEASILMIPKADKVTTRKLQTNILCECRCKNANKILANQTQKHFKRIIHHDQMGFISRMQGWVNIQKSINVIYHIHRMSKKQKQNPT